SECRSGARTVARSSSESASGATASPRLPSPTRISVRVRTPSAATAPATSRSTPAMLRLRIGAVLFMPGPPVPPLLRPVSRGPHLDDRLAGPEQILELPGLQHHAAAEVGGRGGKEREQETG